MASFCCFWCPAKDYKPRIPGEKCAICERMYEAPLLQRPTTIRDYVIQESISRGFYGAAYRAVQQALGRTVVLKVVPVALYQFFNKDWEQECKEHATLAEGTACIAAITDRFDEDVSFGDSSLRCHVAVLANIPGPTLQQLLAEPSNHRLTPRMAAQIAGDLFEVLSTFTQRARFHNDLHAGNVIVQRLTGPNMRSGAIDPSVRAVAVDLGSVKDESLSGDGKRVGDHAHVARQIANLASAVHAGNHQKSDVDYRIAGALRGLAEHLAPAAEAQRVMTPEDALRTIRFAMTAADEPWRQPLSLARFGDAYNAQALDSWHVPALWFDPENKWLTRTTARGPQVITGMRGCGKTMLLRALHFHARAVSQIVEAPPSEHRLQDDFVGVYASCQKLLNPQDHGAHDEVPYPFERLYVAYLRDAVQILRHLRALSPTALTAGIDVLLRDALLTLEAPDTLQPGVDERTFDQTLTDLQFQLADGISGFRLRLAPAEAFGQLAQLIRRASPVLSGKYVLFLLDDVSTRYLAPDMVRRVISQLLFQHSDCAFRITTEAQALQRVLLSPGGSAPADPNRDYEEFDLGNEVYRLLQEGSVRDRTHFVAEILRRRGQQFPDHIYRIDPGKVLGDTKLEDIAREIAKSSPTSPARKQVYHGLRAVQAVCVGDLGDVVKLYEKILLRADPANLPVAADKQTECFLEHSASLMHFLNRRDQRKKSLALAFAQASGELLHRSAKAAPSDEHPRLRQYTKLYVRVDARTDFETVSHQLLDLLDAGVFVYDGGAPRTKTRDHDPVLQFKLSFRKMLGLASFIGLSDRDRFELSGDALRQWLTAPDQAKRILLESEAKATIRGDGGAGDDHGQHEPVELGRTADDSEPPPAPESPRIKHREKRSAREASSEQLQLTMTLKSPSTDPDVCAPKLGLSTRAANLSMWTGRQVDTLVLPLGFEQRTLASARRVLDAMVAERVVLVKYAAGQGAEIERLVRERGAAVHVVTSFEELRVALASADDVAVDTSGLSKPYLFVAVRDTLHRTGHVAIIHTMAEHHYPRNDELLARGVTPDRPVSGEIFASLGEVLTGEAGPYEPVRVHHTDADPDRWRALIASASPKNDRLLHLLDWRSCDAVRILVPSPTTPRRRIAIASAELAASVAGANVALATVDTNDIDSALLAAERIYEDLYFRSGANVELGLTGSKIHAVAFAALAAAARISVAWYVAPQSFDQERFTEGTGETQCFDLLLDQHAMS